MFSRDSFLATVCTNVEERTKKVLIVLLDLCLLTLWYSIPFQEKIRITSPECYKDISTEQVTHIFRSSTSTEIPLLSKRVEHLQEAGKILSEQYNNSVANLVLECNNSARTLMNKIVQLFLSFRDEGNFENQKVAFYKRAQIFVADVWACFEGRGYGKFDDIGSLTMFADYRVPQALQFLGILKYSDELQERIKKEEEIKALSRDEMEIRGCSIHAVECLRENIENIVGASGKNGAQNEELNSVIIDFYLWDYATINSSKMVDFPEHRTRGHFY